MRLLITAQHLFLQNRCNLRNPVKIAILVLLLVILSGCSSLNNSQTLPTPSAECAVLPDWKGIFPGKTTREEVVQLLKRPAKFGIENHKGQMVTYFAYPIESGTVKNYFMDKIFFDARGVVDWMEIAAVDRDENVLEVSEISQQLGDKLDTIYANTNYNPAYKQYDVIGGPDQVYVWANCGVALLAIPYCHLQKGTNQISCDDYDTAEDQGDKNKLTPLESPPFYEGGERENNKNALIVMKIMYPPTSYGGYKENYMFKIPYVGWNFWEKLIKEHNSEQ
jgi:hypothetical protein